MFSVFQEYAKILTVCVSITFVFIEAQPIKWVKSNILAWLKTRIPPVWYGWMYSGANCYQCIGFWVGVIVAIFMQYNIYNIITLGCLSSFACYLVRGILVRWRI